jgi:hypothetical protein
MSGLIRLSGLVMHKTILASFLLSGVLLAQNATAVPLENKTQAGTPALKSAPANVTRQHYRYRPVITSTHAANYYFLRWGVDSMVVRLAESGEIVRFSWRVVDSAKAAQLHDKNAKPALIDPKRQVSLEVPTMEKVGQLRQTGTPEEGRKYWMAFSNKGRPVKAGDRVTVVIGQFRADGLAVE